MLRCLITWWTCDKSSVIKDFSLQGFVSWWKSAQSDSLWSFFLYMWSEVYQLQQQRLNQLPRFTTSVKYLRVQRVMLQSHLSYNSSWMTRRGLCVLKIIMHLYELCKYINQCLQIFYKNVWGFTGFGCITFTFRLQQYFMKRSWLVTGIRSETLRAFCFPPWISTKEQVALVQLQLMI